MTTLLVQYLIIALWTTLNFGAKIVLDPTYGSEDEKNITYIFCF